MKHIVFALVCMISIACIPSRAADQPFTKRHTKAHTFSDSDYLRITANSIYWGFGLGAMYGENQCMEQRCPYAVYCALIGAISAAIATPVCMKLYSKIVGYYKG